MVSGMTVEKLVALSLALAAFMTGCADDEVATDTSPPCKKHDGCDDEMANDEVGDGDGDPPQPGDDNYVYCSTDVGDSERTLHQCNGHLTVSIAFDTIKGPCTEVLGKSGCVEEHDFGAPFDEYSMPGVLACCDADGTPADVLAEYCVMDMVEQVCLSLPARIKSTLAMGIPDDVPFKDVIETQAENLLWWLSTNTQACYDALHKPSNSGAIGPVSWVVNGGKNENWSLLNNLTITLDKGEVLSTSLPDDGRLACSDTSRNDDEVQESRGDAPASQDVRVYYLADASDVTITGPGFLAGGRVQGSATAASQSVCNEPRCSSLVIGDDGVIEDLNLFADGSAHMNVEGMALTVHGLELRLYGAVQAEPVDGSSSVIAPGSAHFRVLGSVGDVSGTRWAENSGPILLHETHDGWMIDAFSVVHVDGLGGTWAASIPLTVWD
jgi:hypothetical protein